MPNRTNAPFTQLSPLSPAPDAKPLLWDIFCRVIDNHGDLGVSWRLSVQLARLGHQVRLWVDDAAGLAWMAPNGQPGVLVLPWANSANPQALKVLPPADVWVEAFGCEIEETFIANYSIKTSGERQKNLKNRAWINLEYLTAEPYALRCHALPSPVMRGPAAGMTKQFFYPGFTHGTGGLLREPDLAERQARFSRAVWLQEHGVPWHGERVVSLFCYEPAALPALLQQWMDGPEPTLLLVTHGRASSAVSAATAQADGRAHAAGQLRIHHLPPLTQTEFDELLWASDLNFVRGEDSLVRALWAGRPLVWNIYPQDDGAHGPKLNAFLDWLDAPADLRRWHAHWNSLECNGEVPLNLPWPPNLAAASRTVESARSMLLEQPDLVTQLLAMTRCTSPL